jgi:hypothetical protein
MQIVLEENFIPNTILTCVRIQRNFAVAKELSGGMEQTNHTGQWRSIASQISDQARLGQIEMGADLVLKPPNCSF